MKRSSAQGMHLVQVGKSLLTSGVAEAKELRLSTPGFVTRHRSKGLFQWWSGDHRDVQEDILPKVLEMAGVVG